MYKCKYFGIKELVSEKVYRKYGERAWSFFDPKLLKTIDKIREHFNRPVTINNWSWNGSFHQRGLRCNIDQIVKDKTDNGIIYISEHVLGRALDFDVLGMTAEEVRAEIISNQDKFNHIKRIEDGVNWVHIDLKATGDDRIYLFKA